ncbi:MAG: succinate dehydrogenase (quinone) flavoprotein subunit, partial [Akkermansiaceae bacterium]
AKGIVVRNLVTGEIQSHAADAVILATGGYGNVFYLSTNAMGCNVMAAFRAHKRGAYMANPCYTQIHPTCIPVSGDYQSKLTLMSESLRNDGRIWVPKSKDDAKDIREGRKTAIDIKEEDRDYYLERKYPSFGNLCPRDIASRAAKECCDEGRGVATSGLGVYLDFKDAIARDGEDAIRARYGNLFQMYEKISGDNPYASPMQIYPAVHYTMGGLWVDYNLMSNLPGLHVLGEANFSDHGANRLGASALMQGLADGYFVIPSTIAVYLSTQKPGAVTTDHPEFKKVENTVRDRLKSLIEIKGNRSVDSFHRELGLLIWDKCGMERDKVGLQEALEKIPAIRDEFWTNVRIPGSANGLNVELEKAGRVADFIEFAEVLCHDALNREESCGGHFRSEHQFFDNDPEVQAGKTQPGEARRHDDEYQYVAAWEHTEPGTPPILHKEDLVYEEVQPSIRSYA